MTNDQHFLRTEVYGVSRNHMVANINQLSRAGFVTPFGENGGIRPVKPANTFVQACGA